jgi:hypothetical protein
MTSGASRRSTARACPLSRWVERQSRLFERMMEKVGADPGATVRGATMAGSRPPVGTRPTANAGSTARTLVARRLLPECRIPEPRSQTGRVTPSGPLERPPTKTGHADGRGLRIAAVLAIACGMLTLASGGAAAPVDGLAHPGPASARLERRPKEIQRGRRLTAPSTLSARKPRNIANRHEFPPRALAASGVFP